MAGGCRACLAVREGSLADACRSSPDERPTFLLPPATLVPLQRGIRNRAALRGRDPGPNTHISPRRTPSSEVHPSRAPSGLREELPFLRRAETAARRIVEEARRVPDRGRRGSGAASAQRNGLFGNFAWSQERPARARAPRDLPADGETAAGKSLERSVCSLEPASKLRNGGVAKGWGERQKMCLTGILGVAYTMSARQHRGHAAP